MLRNLKNISLICFVFSVLIFLFVFGILVGHYKFFPYSIFERGLDGIIDWKENYKHNLRISPERHIGKPRKRYRQTFFRKDGAYPGVTLVSAFIKTKSIPGLLLLDMDGNIIHKWAVSVNKAFPEANRHNWDVLITGAALLTNGEVIFNFDMVGAVKLDWCSKILWRGPFFTHHNIYIDENENIWTAGTKHFTSLDLKTPYQKNLTIKSPEIIMQLSPNGKILKEIKLLDVIINSDLKGTLFANGQTHLYHKTITNGSQFTHLNDVEVLGKTISKKYPMFNTGDIMVSMRNLNLVMILNGTTGLVKWWMVGPFLRQHDPDFDGQGRISIFDNMGGGPKDDIGLASRVISIDPVTKEVEVTYQADPPVEFYTYERGSHQILPNGNMLITETFEGRIFEVNPKGIVVWQYITRWDDERVFYPYQAERYENLYSSYRETNCE